MQPSHLKEIKDQLSVEDPQVTPTFVKSLRQSWWSSTFWKGWYLLLSYIDPLSHTDVLSINKWVFPLPLEWTKAQICPEAEHPPLRWTPWRKWKWSGFASSFPDHLPSHKTCVQNKTHEYPTLLHLCTLHQVLCNTTYLLNSLHHLMFRMSRMALSQDRSFCRLRWKLHSISRRALLNSGPWEPLKMGRGLWWPSSQRANWCWQSQTW